MASASVSSSTWSTISSQQEDDAGSQASVDSIEMSLGAMDAFLRMLAAETGGPERPTTAPAKASPGTLTSASKLRAPPKPLRQQLAGPHEPGHDKVPPTPTELPVTTPAHGPTHQPVSAGDPGPSTISPAVFDDDAGALSRGKARASRLTAPRQELLFTSPAKPAPSSAQHYYIQPGRGDIVLEITHGDDGSPSLSVVPAEEAPPSSPATCSPALPDREEDSLQGHMQAAQRALDDVQAAEVDLETHLQSMRDMLAEAAVETPALDWTSPARSERPATPPHDESHDSSTLDSTTSSPAPHAAPAPNPARDASEWDAQVAQARLSQLDARTHSLAHRLQSIAAGFGVAPAPPAAGANLPPLSPQETLLRSLRAKCMAEAAAHRSAQVAHAERRRRLLAQCAVEQAHVALHAASGQVDVFAQSAARSLVQAAVQAQTRRTVRRGTRTRSRRRKRPQRQTAKHTSSAAQARRPWVN